jgi:hypothetical protein
LNLNHEGHPAHEEEFGYPIERSGVIFVRVVSVVVVVVISAIATFRSASASDHTQTSAASINAAVPHDYRLSRFLEEILTTAPPRPIDTATGVCLAPSIHVPARASSAHPQFHNRSAQGGI